MDSQSQVHIIHATSSPGPENFSHYRINQAVLGPAGLGETALPYHHDRPPDVLDPSTAGRTWPTRGHDVNRYQPALNPIPSGGARPQTLCAGRQRTGHWISAGAHSSSCLRDEIRGAGLSGSQAAVNTARSSCRPRATRDMTVSIGQSAIAAISRYFISSTKRATGLYRQQPTGRCGDQRSCAGPQLADAEGRFRPPARGRRDHRHRADR